jgi:hypothetical protein
MYLRAYETTTLNGLKFLEKYLYRTFLSLYIYKATLVFSGDELEKNYPLVFGQICYSF